MKVLILSDSHGRVGNILDAVEREMPDHIFFLGDVCHDMEDLAALDPTLPISAVAGNCDGWDGGEEEMELSLEGVRCLLTHGHLQNAKRGLWGLVNAGVDREVDAVFFGHTHCAMAQRQPEGLWLVNPGTIGGVHNVATYAVAELADGEMSVELREL